MAGPGGVAVHAVASALPLIGSSLPPVFTLVVAIVFVIVMYL